MKPQTTGTVLGYALGLEPTYKELKLEYWQKVFAILGKIRAYL
ncbi:MAG: hypothetical protein CH6_1061 [Candidatus Kapaibacterium sp.]|nr:MAG: hypothetical protein CH6_1061 [Candidatus Kapabacteria bacterium]